MENSLKSIRDVRFHPTGYSSKVKSDINGISNMLINYFMYEIGRYLPDRKWMMPGTVILVIECEGFEKNEYSNYTKIGNKKSDWISEVRVSMTEKEFLLLDDIAKMQLILNKMKEGFYKFIGLFSDLKFDTSIIETAYNEIIKNNFYLRYTKTYITKDGKYECWMELLPLPDRRRYRIVVNSEDQRFTAFIADVEYWKMHYLEDTNSLKIIGNGWKKHKFYFKYGMPRNYSTIIFDADTKTVENVKK